MSRSVPNSAASSSRRRGPSIDCINLGLQLGGVQILQDINLHLESGKVHCIIGPNGGGKTSFIRSLLGQMPHSGTVETISLQEDNPVIGYLPQLLDFDKTLPVTVSDFMAIVCNGLRPAFAGLGKQPRQHIEAALARVGFHANVHTRLGSLSGGERQRVLFAQALIPEPSLLVLDEPMNNMDQAGEQRYLELIEELKESGVTILWIAHDLTQVKRYADTVTCINRSVVFHGQPEECLAQLETGDLFHLATRRASPDEKMPSASSTQSGGGAST